MVWSQDFQLLNPHSYRHICRKIVSETFKKLSKALSSLCNVFCIKRLVPDLNRTHFTSQAFALISYLGLHCPGNFILSNDFKEKLGVTSFYPTICCFDTCNQKNTVWSKSPHSQLHRAPKAFNIFTSVYLSRFCTMTQPRHYLTAPGVQWMFFGYSLGILWIFSGYSLSVLCFPEVFHGAVGSIQIPKPCWPRNQRGKPSSELCWDSIWNKGFVWLCLWLGPYYQGPPWVFH